VALAAEKGTHGWSVELPGAGTAGVTRLSLVSALKD